jgi:hypothetical protein
MALIEVNWNPSRRELRQFAGIWLPAFLLVVGAVLFFRLDWRTAGVSLWSAAAVICAAGWVMPQAFRPVYVAWMAAALPIGWTISHLMMGFVYFVVMTPIGISMRLAGRDPMSRAFDTAVTSYWTPRSAAVSKVRYLRQF